MKSTQHIRKKLSIIILAIMLCSPTLLASPPKSFSEAKKIARVLFNQNQKTLYCDCQYSKYQQINLKSCNLQYLKQKKRAQRVEWEHMMPAEHFGRHLSCWRQKICVKRNGKAYRGRKCCRRMSPKFRAMEAELYNLWPSVGLINQYRSNYRYAEIRDIPPISGCDFTVNKSQRSIMPRNAIKGLVARANLFMAFKYNVRLSKGQKRLFSAWDRMYPPTPLEKKWAHKVGAIEGYENPFITQ